MSNYIIDGHNLIPKVPGLSLKSLDDEQELITLLQEYCRIRRRSVEVYFDRAPVGLAGARVYGSVKAHFVRKGITADNAIIARLRQLGRGAQNWTVVTSDRRVQIEARALGSKVMTSEEFSKDITIAQEEERASRPVLKDSGLTPDEIEEWLRLFGDRGSDKFSRDS